MLSLWEELLILRATWSERLKDRTIPFSVSLGEFWKTPHDELDEIIKRHTRVKVPLDSYSTDKR